MKLEFIECDACAAKPGTPPLCRGCLHNREVITRCNMIIAEIRTMCADTNTFDGDDLVELAIDDVARRRGDTLKR